MYFLQVIVNSCYILFKRMFKKKGMNTFYFSESTDMNLDNE